MAVTQPKADETAATARIADALAARDRRALARAVTLVESTRQEDRARARALLERLGPAPDAALRLGLSGPPGVGKSTFIEALGLRLVDAGRRVAVLAIDPSSARTGGSILGDKTRMPLLARSADAYIRPSPARSTLGGVARRTREAIRLVEAAGFDVVIVETVGVGQSETMAADMTDVFALLASPGGGDELQGVKRGVMEAADIVLVNKADGATEAIARSTAGEYASALRLFPKRAGDPEGAPSAMALSAATGAGVAEAWDAIEALDAHRRVSGARAARRAAQAVKAYEAELDAALRDLVRADPRVAAIAPGLEAAVVAGRVAPDAAVDQVLALFKTEREPSAQP